MTKVTGNVAICISSCLTKRKMPNDHHEIYPLEWIASDIFFRKNDLLYTPLAKHLKTLFGVHYDPYT